MQTHRWTLALITALLFLAACTDSTSQGEDIEAQQAQTDADGDADATEAASEEGAGPTVSIQVERGDVDDEPAVVGRTNVQASGNRYLPGSLDLNGAPDTVDLPFVAAWVVPLNTGTVVAVGEDGTAVSISPDGTISDFGSVDPTVAPLALDDNGVITLVPNTGGVASDLPDAHEVEAGTIRAWFDGATERLPHGALGDTTEATRLVIIRRLVTDPMDDTGEQLVRQERIVVDLENDPTGSVFEGIAPLLVDINNDGAIEIVATVSDGETGARLAVFSSDGEQLAVSDPVGQRNRWRHQIAVAPIGPNGETEIVEVQTPHIGGLLQFQRLEGDALTLQFQVGEFRSHVLASRNLDGAVVFDGDGDGTPEAVVPTQDLASIAVVDSEPNDAGPLLVDLGGATVSSNLALNDIDGQLIFAVALSDGRLLTWR